MKYTLIQGWRGLLSASVVLIHVKIYLVMFNYDPSYFNYVPDILGAIPCGFFAISGYFMATLVAKNSPNFLISRIIRVYPTYFLIIAIAFALREFTSMPLSSRNLLKVASLMPFGPGLDYKLGIEWTLVFEVFYYLVCAVFCRPSLSRYFPGFLSVWLMVVLGWAVLKPVPMLDALPNFSFIFLSGWNYCFIAGALTYYLQNYSKDLRVRVVAAGLSLFTVIAALLLDGMQGFIIFLCGLFSCVFMLVLLRVERSVKSPPILTKLGDYSYCLYLIHPTIVLVVIERWHMTTGNVSPVAAGLLSVILCLILSWWLGKVDIAMYAFFKGKLSAVLGSGKRPAQK